jgi:stage IV sporulation protein FB
MREVSRGLLARDAMISRFESLAPSDRIELAVQKLLATSQHEFPVVDGSGKMRGLVTRNDIIRGLREKQPNASVAEIMQADIPVIDQRQYLKDAMALIHEKGKPAVAVHDGAGRMVGLITRENLGELMIVLTEDPAGRWTPVAGAIATRNE